MKYILYLSLLILFISCETTSSKKKDPKKEQEKTTEISKPKLVQKKKIPGFIDKTGKLIIPLENFFHANPFSEGLAPVLDYKSKLWGYIDHTGKVVIQPKFKSGGSFHSGLAKFKKGKLYGFINKNGKVVIQPKYSSVKDFKTSYTLAKLPNNNKYLILHSSGKEISSSVFPSNSNFQKSEYKNKRLRFKQERKYGFKDLSNRTVIPPIFDKVYPFRYGIAVVGQKENGKPLRYGMIDIDGNSILPTKYKQVSTAWNEFGDNKKSENITFSAYSKKEGCSIYNKDLEKIIHIREIKGMECFGIEPYKYGLARILLMDRDEKDVNPWLGIIKQSFIDKDGQLVFEPMSLQFKNFNSVGTSPFCNFNRSVIATFFDSKKMLQKSKTTEKKCGFINREGQIVFQTNEKFLDPSYVNYSSEVFDDRWLESRRIDIVNMGNQDKKSIVNYIGKEIKLNTTEHNIKIYNAGEGMIPFCTKVRDKRKCGYYNTEGQMVIPAKYRNVTPFSEGLAFVSPATEILVEIK